MQKPNILILDHDEVQYLANAQERAIEHILWVREQRAEVLVDMCNTPVSKYRRQIGA
ncbi:hypothetical protein [Methylomicrobium agile]|uniref:hypothetical protein n=1 Tax=Methylomicrobium agile TaxID=39774 RepID=UPI0012F65C47|nr:hypothetical protein [Methylomicrobium agile]